MRIPHIKKLQTRFLVCYVCVIILPILLLSGVIYNYQNNQIKQAYLNAKKDTLLSDKNYLDNKLQQMNSYYNQFTACAGLSDILEEISPTNKQIVYKYISEVSPQLNNVKFYDSYIDSIRIYTYNTIAADILNEFVAMKDFYLYNSNGSFSKKTKHDLYSKFWKLKNVDNRLTMTYYAGFMYSALSKISGVLEINCNDNMFKNYAFQDKDSVTYICDSHSLIFHYRESSVMNNFFLKQQAMLLQPAMDSYVALSSDNRILISSFSLNKGHIRIIKLSPVTIDALSFRPLALTLILCFVILTISSAIIFQTVFVPFKNISQFSTHLSLAHKPLLVPYKGLAPNDEVGELIRTYNQMTERINSISQTLHNNEIQLKNAQLEALQTQLNPHFFYGTLESIRMLAEANHQTLISEIAFSFGNLMRYALSREYLVPVNLEISIVEQYLNIQSKRLSDRFSVVWDVCDLDAKWRCPKFVLFSLVENVFSHNINQTRHVVHLRIIIASKDNDLTITVENDGPGISPERLSQILYLKDHPEERSNMTSLNNGRGIFNIHDRIQLFYGPKYGITLTSEENVLTVCSLKINKLLIGFNPD